MCEEIWWKFPWINKTKEWQGRTKEPLPSILQSLWQRKAWRKSLCVWERIMPYQRPEIPHARRIASWRIPWNSSSFRSSSCLDNRGCFPSHLRSQTYRIRRLYEQRRIWNFKRKRSLYFNSFNKMQLSSQWKAHRSKVWSNRKDQRRFLVPWEQHRLGTFNDANVWSKARIFL